MIIVSNKNRFDKKTKLFDQSTIIITCIALIIFIIYGYFTSEWMISLLLLLIFFIPLVKIFLKKNNELLFIAFSEIGNLIFEYEVIDNNNNKSHKTISFKEKDITGYQVESFLNLKPSFIKIICKDNIGEIISMPILIENLTKIEQQQLIQYLDSKISNNKRLKLID